MARQQRYGQILIAAVCCASCFGLSIYLGIGLAASFAVWTILCLFRGKRREAFGFLIAGTTALVLLVPFLQSLAQAAGHREFPLELDFRHFSLMEPLIRAGAPLWILECMRFLGLPLNYLIAFGLILDGAVCYWLNRRFSALTR